MAGPLADIAREPETPAAGGGGAPNYVLEDQIGFLLRQVHQAHAAIFAARFGDDLTPTQWAVTAKLFELGACSQNLLGRLTAMDGATIKGVVDRLVKRGQAAIASDPADRRRVLVTLTPAGRATYLRFVETASAVSQETLRPLAPEEKDTLLRLLKALRPGDEGRGAAPWQAA